MIECKALSGGGGGAAGSIAWLPGGEAREEHTVVVNPNQMTAFDAIPYLLAGGGNSGGGGGGGDGFADVTAVAAEINQQEAEGAPGGRAAEIMLVTPRGTWREPDASLNLVRHQDVPYCVIALVTRR